MLKNVATLAIRGVSTAEDEPLKVCLIFQIRDLIFAEPPRPSQRLFRRCKIWRLAWSVSDFVRLCSNSLRTVTRLCICAWPILQKSCSVKCVTLAPFLLGEIRSLQDFQFAWVCVLLLAQGQHFKAPIFGLNMYCMRRVFGCSKQARLIFSEFTFNRVRAEKKENTLKPTSVFVCVYILAMRLWAFWGRSGGSMIPYHFGWPSPRGYSVIQVILRSFIDSLISESDSVVVIEGSQVNARASSGLDHSVHVGTSQGSNSVGWIPDSVKWSFEPMGCITFRKGSCLVSCEGHGEEDRAPRWFASIFCTAGFFSFGASHLSIVWNFEAVHKSLANCLGTHSWDWQRSQICRKAFCDCNIAKFFRGCLIFLIIFRLELLTFMSCWYPGSTTPLEMDRSQKVE